MEQIEVKAAPDSEEQMQVEEEAEEPAPELLLATEASPAAEETADAQLKAILEALVYVTDEPLTAGQIATTVAQPVQRVTRLLEEIAVEFNKPEHGLTIREVAGGYKMATKAEYHEPIRAFVKNLKPPLKLSLAALETLAVVAYKQPITSPEIMEIRGVQGAGVLKTLLDRKLIAVAGRKHVLGKPILYKTTKEFLIQFGLRDLSELPTLKEFEELGRFAFSEESEASPAIPETTLIDTRAQEPDPDPGPEREPPADPEPVREPEPAPQPIHEPDPGQPGDPQHEPVKADN